MRGWVQIHIYGWLYFFYSSIVLISNSFASFSFHLLFTPLVFTLFQNTTFQWLKSTLKRIEFIHIHLRSAYLNVYIQSKLTITIANYFWWWWCSYKFYWVRYICENDKYKRIPLSIRLEIRLKIFNPLRSLRSIPIKNWMRNKLQQQKSLFFYSFQMDLCQSIAVVS